MKKTATRAPSAADARKGETMARRDARGDIERMQKLSDQLEGLTKSVGAVVEAVTGLSARLESLDQRLSTQLKGLDRRLYGFEADMAFRNPSPPQPYFGASGSAFTGQGIVGRNQASYLDDDI